MDAAKQLVDSGSKLIKIFFTGEIPSSNIPEIERSFIRLGYLYDASKDSITGQLYTHIKTIKKPSSDKASCIMYKENDIQSENFAKILHINDETWLSATLNIFEPSGILSNVNDLVSIDNLTRFIYYFYQSQEE